MVICHGAINSAEQPQYCILLEYRVEMNTIFISIIVYAFRLVRSYEMFCFQLFDHDVRVVGAKVCGSPKPI